MKIGNMLEIKHHFSLQYVYVTVFANVKPAFHKVWVIVDSFIVRKKDCELSVLIVCSNCRPFGMTTKLKLLNSFMASL